LRLGGGLRFVVAIVDVGAGLFFLLDFAVEGVDRVVDLPERAIIETETMGKVCGLGDRLDEIVQEPFELGELVAALFRRLSLRHLRLCTFRSGSQGIRNCSLGIGVV
jgi:hypothetical protein